MYQNKKIINKNNIKQLLIIFISCDIKLITIAYA